MASYKAEFLSHHYARRRRPRQAWFMGRIGQWAPFAARAPWLANLATSFRPLAPVSKWIAGVAKDRALPVFAPRTFRATAAAQGHRNAANARRGTQHQLFHGVPAAVVAGRGGSGPAGVHLQSRLLHRARAARLAEGNDDRAARDLVGARTVRHALRGRAVHGAAHLLDLHLLRL